MLVAAGVLKLGEWGKQTGALLCSRSLDFSGHLSEVAETVNKPCLFAVCIRQGLKRDRSNR